MIKYKGQRKDGIFKKASYKTVSELLTVKQRIVKESLKI
jgi:hypothetical protein